MIELCGPGWRDGERGTVQASHLAHGILTPERDPPGVTDYVSEPTDWPELTLRQVLWQWDGTTTADGTFRFRRA